MASAEVGKVDAVSLTFMWEIENFCISCKNVGDCLESPKFTAKSESSDIQWFLKFYPKGISEDYKDYLSLFLQASQDIKATCSFKILDNEGQVVVDKILDENVLYKYNSWGYNKFVSRNFVTNPVNGILNDDKMTIVCEITYRNSEVKNNKVTKREVEDQVSRRLEDEYRVLLNDSIFSDVSLISEGKAVKVHKCILASRSSVFAGMFDADMKQYDPVEITDVKYDVLMEMIRFVYVAKVDNIDRLANDLAVAADIYALEGLKNMCEMTMIKNLNVDNVISCLQLADRICMDKLKKKAIELIVENARDISDKPEFDSLSRDIMSKVFRCLANKNKY